MKPGLSIQTKTLLAIAGVFAVLVGVLLVLSQSLIVNAFSKLENEYVARNMLQIRSAFDDFAGKLFSTAGDWSGWDDTWQFVEDKNRQYIDDNLAVGAFANLDINMMIFFQRNGTLAYGRNFEISVENELPIPADLLSFLTQHRALMADTAGKTGKRGIIMLQNSALAVAIRPILRNNSQGPCRGSLLVGRYLDSAEIAHLNATTHLAFDAYPLNRKIPEPYLQAIGKSLSQDQQVTIKPVDTKNIMGYTVLADITGDPALLIKARFARDIYRQGQRTIYYAMIWVIGITFIFAALTMLLLHRMVTARLGRLSARLDAIRSSADAAMRLPEMGADELGKLAITINSMLIALENNAKEREQMQSQLMQAQKMQAIGLLAGGVAHDFNNMLGAVLGFAELIQMKFANDNPALKKYTDSILATARRMSDLASELLAFARKGKYDVVILDIHQVIDDVIQLLEHTLDKRITITKRLMADPACIMGDATQLHNALLNLAVNARDAMPDGGALTFATATAELDDAFIDAQTLKITPGTYLKLSVSDTGTGMDEQTRARIFEPFFTTKEIGRGTGIGLASVLGAVENHGGCITVGTTPGAGTIFSIYLPAVQPAHEDRAAPAENAEPVKGSGTILVIDDEEGIQAMAEEMLTELGYHVRICKDGKEGIAYYHQHWHEINLVIIDIIMPAIGGFACFKGLKEINPSVKAIVASGFSVDGEARRILKEGALGFIQKPYEMRRMSHVIRDAFMKS
jgi:signal transduction histidine kinase/CheY-like chemotaxis protein